MLSFEQRNVGEKRGIGRLTSGREFVDDVSKLAGVSMNDGGGEQVQLRHAMVLTL